MRPCSTISAMKTLRLFAAFLWLATVCPCAAQLMDAAGYRDYMKEMDAAAERWQKQINSIDVGRLKLSYEKGKFIEHLLRATLSDLKSLRSSIAMQRSGTEESLSKDIEIEETMGDTYLDFDNLLSAIPQDDVGLFLQGSLTPIMTELQSQQLRLRSHIQAYADGLQSKAKGCSK